MTGRSDRRIRVLWLIKGLGVGGAERLLASESTSADRDRFHYEVAYLLPWKDALVGELEAAGVSAHCLNVRDVRDLSWLPRLRRLLNDGAYDVVHLHSPYVAGLARLVIRSIPRRRRPRVVSTEHNVWWSYVFPTRLANAVTYLLDDARLAVSDEVRRSIPWPLRRDVEVVTHGIRLDDLDFPPGHRSAMRASLGVAEDEVVALTVGNFRPQKGYNDLLAAARSVLDRGTRVRFLVVGHGPLENELRELHHRLGLGDSVVFLGFRNDAVAVAAACDLFVLASLHEGFPVAVMEAMAIGLPVVATTVGGVPDVVGDGIEGIVVPPHRPDLLADAITEVVRDADLRRRMAEASLARRSEFDIERATRRIEALYRDLVGR